MVEDEEEQAMKAKHIDEEHCTVANVYIVLFDFLVFYVIF